MKRLLTLALCAALSLTLAAPASALAPEDALRLLERYYLEPLPEKVYSMQSVEEIIAALDDPYTAYMPAESYQQMLNSTNGTFVGIGATVSGTFENGGYEILEILPDSPAQAAGLKVGDVILAVDGNAMSEDAAPADFIRGEEGTSVTLTLRRADGRTQDLTLIRRAVESPIVTYEQVENVGYIDCTSFGDSTVQTIRQALEEMENSVDTWVVDLRTNPGGTSTSAAGSAGLFIGANQVVSFFLDNSGIYDTIHTSASCPDLTDKPVIILTSPQSASGSELFSAAIRDHGAGIAVGQCTYGKGVGQDLLDERTYPELFDGDGMRITAFRFFSPDGATNHFLGVMPTLLISPENTEAAALLLSCPWSPYPENHLQIELAGQKFCVNVSKALEPELRPALTELLEALPPSAQVLYSTGQNWEECDPISPADLAEELGLPFQSRSFTDTQGSRFQTSIDALACYGLLSGYVDGTYRPGQDITRAEFSAMVATALNLPISTAENVYSDIAKDAWYAEPVSAMTSRGFLSGYEDGTFHPEAPITCQEMACVLSKAAVWACMDATDYALFPPDPGDPAYADYSPWARDAASILDRLGALPEGLEPAAEGDRQTAAAMLYGMLEGANLLWD